MEDAAPTEKTVRRFLVVEAGDVCRLGSNERLEYIGVIGASETPRRVFEVVLLSQEKQAGNAAT